MINDLRQARCYADYIKSLGWSVDKFLNINIFIKKFLFWKFIKIQRPGEEIFKLLEGCFAKKYQHSTIYIEPDNFGQYDNLLKLGFKKYNSPFLPSKTLQIDLSKSENELLKDMHYKTRYNIKHYLSFRRDPTNVGVLKQSFSKDNNRTKEFQITKSNDIYKFADFWQKCAKDRGMFLDQKKEIKAIFEAFGKDANIHVASLCRSGVQNDSQGTIEYQRLGVNDVSSDWLAAILRISTKDISYYMYAASTEEGKKLFAPTILTWEAIKASKKEGKKIFDFEGIYDERFPLKSWKGFSRFKKSFGGKEIVYPGTLWKMIV